MCLKRQPTFKTWILLAGVAAVLSAATAIVPREDWHGPGYYDVHLRFWLAAAIASVFWLVLPLLIGILVQSPRTASKMGLGLGLFVLALNWVASTRVHLRLGYANVPVEQVVLSVLYGPLLCFDVLRAIWESTFSDSQLVLFVICVLWISAYCFVTFHVAASCRVRKPLDPAVG